MALLVVVETRVRLRELEGVLLLLATPFSPLLLLLAPLTPIDFVGELSKSTTGYLPSNY